MRLTRSILTTPLGDMLALVSCDGLCALEFAAPKQRLSRLEARLRRHFPPHEIEEGETATTARTREWLRAYFDGVSAEVGDLPIDMHGAAFERRGLGAPLEVRPGETTSHCAGAARPKAP